MFKNGYVQKCTVSIFLIYIRAEIMKKVTTAQKAINKKIATLPIKSPRQTAATKVTVPMIFLKFIFFFLISSFLLVVLKLLI